MRTRWWRMLGAAVVGALVLAGCEIASSGAQKDRPLVLTTFTVLADIAQNVAGDHLEVASLTKAGAEIHGYEPTPRDIAAASEADLVLDNGLGLEAWFAQFVDSVDVPHVVVSEGVEVMDITGDVDAGKPNPHAWMSPLNVQVYVENMVEAFSQLDPEHAEDYAAQGAEYTAQLQESTTTRRRARDRARGAALAGDPRGRLPLPRAGRA